MPPAVQPTVTDPLLETPAAVLPEATPASVLQGTLEALNQQMLPDAEATEAVEPEPVLESPAVITGQVSITQGQIQGAEVVLILPDGEMIQHPVDEQGSFIIENLTPGDYTLEALAPGSLTLQATVTLAEGQQVQLPAGTLRLGDINQDNLIDFDDVVLVAANYGGPAEIMGTDLNGDQLIDIIDLTMIGAQFGIEGPLPWDQP